MTYYPLDDEREIFKIGKRAHDWLLKVWDYFPTLERVQETGFDNDTVHAYRRDGNLEVTVRTMKDIIEACICELRGLPVREFEGEAGTLHDDNLGMVIASMVASGHIIPSQRRPSTYRTITGVKNVTVYILRRDA